MGATHPEPGRSPLALALLVLAALNLLTLPRLVTEDSLARSKALDELLRAGTVSTSRYSLIGPLLAAPLWAAAGPDAKAVAVWRFNSFVMLAGAAGLWWALAPVLAAATRMRFLLLLGFASVTPYHAAYFGGEPFTMMCVGVGTAAAIVRRKWWGWPLAALGAANVPATLVGLALAAGVTCWHRGRLRYALAVIGAAALVFAENGLRRGSLFAAGYDNDHGFATILPYSGRPGFSYPFALDLLAILLSFGKALVFFIPALLLPLDRDPDATHDREADLRLLYRVWLAFVVGLVLVHARWWAWYGGVFWGPRFFLFAALPAALVLARRLVAPDPRPGVNLLVLGVLLLSCWVGTTGSVFRDSGPPELLKDDFAHEFVLWYVPEFSPLCRPFVVPPILDARDTVRLLVFVAATVYLATPLSRTVAHQLFTVSRARLPRLRF